MSTGRARCPGCGDKFTPERHVAGRDVACSQTCAAILASRLLAAGVRLDEHLPGDQRPDLVPWDAWQSATRIDGKNQWRKR